MSQDKGRLFFLDGGFSKHAGDTHELNGRICSSKPDGSDFKTVVPDIKHMPDGITIDSEKKHIWWTNMGDPEGKHNNGSIHRCDIDGSNVVTIVPTVPLTRPNSAKSRHDRISCTGAIAKE